MGKYMYKMVRKFDTIKIKRKNCNNYIEFW